MEVVSAAEKTVVNDDLEYDHAKEMQGFIETKAGVKGLVDSGVVKVPRIFIHPPDDVPISSSNYQVPVIDLSGLQSHRRLEIVKSINDAAQTWGFFQMINHGIPDQVMAELLSCIHRFNEQPKEVKLEYYSYDNRRRLKYYSNGYLNSSKPGNWRDSLSCEYSDEQLDAEALPNVCREPISEYMKHIFQVKENVSELLSEALGLSSDYLASLECMKTASLGCNYYPICPEPNFTLGVASHSDPFFLTILLQDNIGGLQILHDNHWVNLPHLQGSLVANIGDFMQLISNDKFKSVVHRVVAGSAGNRVSASCFFLPGTGKIAEPYGPVKELLSENNPPIYKQVSFREYISYYQSRGLDGGSALNGFKLI